MKNDLHREFYSNKRHYVVYKYFGSRVECISANYIGHTSCSLLDQLKCFHKTVRSTNIWDNLKKLQTRKKRSPRKYKLFSYREKEKKADYFRDCPQHEEEAEP